jgi:adenylate cyclase
VVIDEKSLEELGQWPWSRILMARLIEILSEYGARVIGLDVVWPEPERRMGVLDSLYGAAESPEHLPLLQEIQSRYEALAIKHKELDEFLRSISSKIQPDRVLAEAIASSGRVVLGNFFIMNPQEVPHIQEDSGQLPPLIRQSEYPLIRKPRSLRQVPHLPRPFFMKGNIPTIANAGKAFGFFNMVPDIDGVVRSVPLVMEYRGYYLPPLSLQTLRYAGDPDRWILHLEEFGVAGIQRAEQWIPTTEMGFFYINYRGKQGTFPWISAVDVLRHRVDPSRIRDKIVLIGAVATGIFDLRVTPLSAIFPGVEIHANIIDNLIEGDYIIRPEWAALMDLLFLLLMGMVLGWAYPRMRPVSGGIVMLALFVGNLYVNSWVMARWGYWLNVIYPSLLIPLSFLGVSLFRYIHEEREKRKIKGAFQFYVTPAVVNEILKDPKALRLGGEQKVLTVLFSDIRGFTSISESLSPERLVHLLNEYLTEMTGVVFRYGGTLDKYIGDALMAIYGAPLPQEDHPLKACQTALDMMDELKALQKKWEDQGMPRIDIGIGINTGEMVVGNMGSAKRFDYTVIGDSVNLASRLEGLNKAYGTHILISEFTEERVRGEFLCREVDWVRVKGKAKPVRIYEILGRRGVPAEDEGWLPDFEEGLALYREREWIRAEECFQRVLDKRPEDPPSLLYVERCRHLRRFPPPAHWDGVFEWEVK